MARRGFFAELQHQQKLAEQRVAQQQRADAAAQKRFEAATKAAERADAASQRASEADRKRLEKAAMEAHVAAMQAEAEALSESLAVVYSDLDGLLQATLDVDDFVDLDSLRVSVSHPPFDRTDLAVPTPLPAPIADPVEPVRVAVLPSKALFGRQKKTEEAQAIAEAEFLRAHEAWWYAAQAVPAQRAELTAKHAAAEETRKAALAQERARYNDECAQREAEVSEHNAGVDALITNLGYGTEDAVNEYAAIVLANSVYPDHFDVEHEAQFDPEGAELAVRVTIPAPISVPSTKSYKYTKATDEITPVALTQRDTKTRYADIVNQVALRTLNEVFEADRRNLIQSISLEVGTETNVPATGKMMFIPLLAVGASRDRFVDINLSGVVPSATLEHLGAAVSKYPFDLVPANVSGVRRS